ncbi:MAG: VWA domain-containing protein [Byssovorax sp.]
MTAVSLGCSTSSFDPTSSGGAGGMGTSTGGGAESSGQGGGAPSDVRPASEANLATANAPGTLAACSPIPGLSTPVSLSVPSARAMVSAAQVRGILEAPGGASTPPPGLFRAAEIFNYYHIDYPATAAPDVTLVAELVPAKVPGDYLFQIALQAPPSNAQPRRPTALTIVVDTSQSMAGEPMLRANAALHALAASLTKGDVLNYLTTDPELAPVHRIAEIEGDPGLFKADDEIKVGGSGTLGAGVERAYEQALAEASYRKDGINRLVVITDGGGPASAINAGLVAKNWDGSGIKLVGVGVGSAGGYNNALLAAATTAGHGPSLYLDSVEEADRALHVRFDEVMDEAVSDAYISFSLPWLFKPALPESSLAVDQAFLTLSDLGRGRSMVFRHTVSMCPGVDPTQLGDLPIEVLASWRVPGMADRQELKTTLHLNDVLLEKPTSQTLKASAIIAFGNALQSLDHARFQDACEKVTMARAHISMTPGDPAADPELDSILKQLNAHPLMKDQPCP